MIKTHCQALIHGTVCNTRLPGTKKYNDIFGNYCEKCSGKTGYYHSKKIRESMNKTPLETDTIKRLREEAELAEKVQDELDALSDKDYEVLSKNVSNELLLGDMEKAQSITLEIGEQI